MTIPLSEQRDPETYAAIGAAMEVHRRLGHGFLESVYHAAFAIELERNEIFFERERALSTAGLTGVDDSQVINYLKVSGLKKGLLLNFGTSTLQYRRFVV